MSSTLESKIQYLKSVGPKRAEAFNYIGLFTIRDLLFYFPSRYLDRSNILSTNKILEYVRSGYEGEVTVIASVTDKKITRYGRKQIMKVIFQDDHSLFECVWFQGIRYFQSLFNEGEFFALSAKPSITKYGNLQFVHPDFDKLSVKESTDFLNTGKIIPFYTIPKLLREKKIGDLSLRKIIHNAVVSYSAELTETLPQQIINDNKLTNIQKAVESMHFPSNYDELEEALKRFKLEELFYLELIIALRRKKIISVSKPKKLEVNPKSIKEFLERIPFELTESQLRVLHEIRLDFEKITPMNRLLQGDVGSGKTIVAVIAMMIVTDNGLQAAYMAPTEILANQHFQKIKDLLKDFGLNIELIIGGQTKKERSKILASIKSGDTDIVIGTHALFEEEVEFKNLGFVVIDEQHRFGVLQRSRLIAKGMNPDVLIMTATPIPRTLTMTLYGDLDISINDQMPKNRIPINTQIRGEKSLPKIYRFIIEKAAEGYQTYIIYPLVEESDKLDLKAAESYYDSLRSTYFESLRVGMIHGKMKWRDKDKVMSKFAHKEIDVLISTTVIEVGIDIPDANIIIINDAFRFGLSQLHQLRGRVGRSNRQAYCVLVTKDEHYARSAKTSLNIEYMSQAAIEKNKSIIRLNAMAEYSDGFKLSEIDMKLRGPGDIFGLKQSGFPELKYADITSDGDLIELAKRTAFKIIDEDPKLENSNNALLRQSLINYHSDKLKYAKTP